MISHPLVSPLAAKVDHWVGAPSVYVSVGWEGMQDESEVFARRIHEAGAGARFDGYVGMPHAFAVVPWCWLGRRAMVNWAAFCSQVVQIDTEMGRGMRKGMGTWIDKNGAIREVGLERLGMRDVLCGREKDLTDEVVGKLMAEQKEWRVRLEVEMMSRWKDKGLEASFRGTHFLRQAFRSNR
jgi:hypothetical protein